ncbi:hypothetical protein J2W17_003350 [Pseudomonas lini]|uniref:hypothetical protein n=1 Tax=Pseudomonas lini TaxID=163011 RepID=UPI00277E5894|nr:hypothetical protein [Pseudomonas lini]MDQ0124400.1 hypothetical protein [Pseudomonas lini]
MIEPYEKSRTPELKKLLKLFSEHQVSNPDDDPDLSGTSFKNATDHRSQELLEKIEEVGRVVLFDHNGNQQGQSRAAIRRAGFRVAVVGDPYDENERYKTTVQIETPHGHVTIDASRITR